MNNYEKITAIIKSGHLAVCERKYQGTIIYSYVMNSGSIRRNGHCGNNDKIGINCEDEDDVNKHIFTSITPLNTFKPLKIGDKVMIMENAKELPEYKGWEITQRGMVGNGPFEIKSITGYSYFIVHNDTKISGFFPFHTVCLYIGEDKPIETIEIGGLKYSKEEVENALKGLKSLS